MTVITTSGQDRLSAAFAAWERQWAQASKKAQRAAGMDVNAVLDNARCRNCVHFLHLASRTYRCMLTPESRDTHPNNWCGEHPTRAAVAAYLESEALSALFGGPNEREPYPCRS